MDIVLGGGDGDDGVEEEQRLRKRLECLVICGLWLGLRLWLFTSEVLRGLWSSSCANRGRELSE